ncbi:MAG: FecR family protein [Bacteroidales bacterium]|nr:FecR family protein [Bacteroidales bacterium]MBN2756201.1 FecR family protein [Bacteroidales bacterium]
MLDLAKISKYLSGEMDKNEEKEFIKLINKSNKNIELFKKAKKNWEMIGKYEEKENYNVDSAWNKLHSRFEKDGLLENKNKSLKLDFYQITRIAAIFIIGTFISVFAYYAITNYTDLSLNLAQTSEKSEIEQVNLPDGSVIYLNRNSKLYYPDKFDNQNRIVKFEGEAFFEIAKMPEKPFIIKINGAEVKVLGTSFNINTKIKNKKLEVTVKTGKVKLYNSDNQNNSIILENGFVGSISNNKIEKTVNKNPNYLSWKTKYFEFNNQSLVNVTKELNKAYNVDIEFNGSFNSEQKLNTIFDNKSIESILEIICSTYNLKVEKQKDKIVLKAKK